MTRPLEHVPPTDLSARADFYTTTRAQGMAPHTSYAWEGELYRAHVEAQAARVYGDNRPSAAPPNLDAWALAVACGALIVYKWRKARKSAKRYRKRYRYRDD